MGPGEVSRYWSSEAIAEMRAHPRLTATRFLRKLRWAFGSEDLADTRTFEFYVVELPALRFLPWDFGLVSVLGLVGAFLSVRDRRRAVVVAFVALLGLALSIFFVYGRYRLPLLVPLAILAGAVPQHLSALALSGARRALAAVAALAVVTAWLVFGEVLPGLEPSFLPDYYNQGNRYATEGRLDLALVEYEKAITVRPGDHPALSGIAVRVADLHLLRGDARGARRVLDNALRARPGDPVLSAKLAALAAP
jgi:tetratricopeptide (TPR) repeat protein